MDICEVCNCPLSSHTDENLDRLIRGFRRANNDDYGKILNTVGTSTPVRATQISGLLTASNRRAGKKIVAVKMCHAIWLDV